MTAPGEQADRGLAGRPYRPGVGIFLLNAAGEVFVARRIDTRQEAWQMPQGGIDEGETPRQAVLREMAEEIGTDNAKFLAESRDWLSYDLPPELASRVWKGRYRGQKQKWFALRFLGQDSDINLETPKPEFLTWRWLPADRLPDLIVPFKRALYRDVLAEFADLLR